MVFLGPLLRVSAHIQPFSDISEHGIGLLNFHEDLAFTLRSGPGEIPWQVDDTHF